ncbi:hypothetical protein HPB52_003383 [Rhipicephalus sanguineus]|uniref:Uncharacterized protein n=1 Tax=Rhipicephalus sanguineus TaxID=34632 RepID=A0A9D4QGV7_RHISA|nr:hypothetical protein HPB52_003383 [Rhipicephalus sanguineus]
MFGPRGRGSDQFGHAHAWRKEKNREYALKLSRNVALRCPELGAIFAVLVQQPTHACYCVCCVYALGVDEKMLLSDYAKSLSDPERRRYHIKVAKCGSDDPFALSDDQFHERCWLLSQRRPCGYQRLSCSRDKFRDAGAA